MMTPELWNLERGANHADGATRFSVWAPKANSVEVKIPEGPSAGEHAMEQLSDGSYVAVVAGATPGADYFYRLDRSRDRPDPVSRWQPAGVHGPSRIVDPDAFPWTDEDWTGIDRAELVLYELHVGTFTGAGTFGAVCERLPELRELGVTAIELMPVAQFPGSRNWGYDGVHLYAPQNSYGGPTGLKRLVDAAHDVGLGVFLDVVYNHLGPEGNYLREFGPYFTDRYQTPWGEAINFDGRGSDEVRRFFIDSALYWLCEYHIDGLRLDAAHAIFDFSAIHILEELTNRAHQVAEGLGRTVHVIAESDLNDPRLVRPREAGGYALDGQWNGDFHHAIHAALTGERQGYYQDFGAIEAVGRAFEDRFVLDGRYSTYRGRRHGAPARDVPRDRFVAFVQNHDQVGNRAQGERLSKLISLEAYKLAATVLLLSPYIPLLFMGEEYGETAPFLYFVDHGDPSLREAVRAGRLREFAGFDWQGPIPDPSDPETFQRSRIDPTLAEARPHDRIRNLYRDLLALRRAEPALRPGAAAVSVKRSEDEGLLAVGYEPDDGAALMAAFNFSSGSPARMRWPAAGRWRRRFATDDPCYGGSGPDSPPELVASAPARRPISIPPLTAVLYAGEPASSGDG